MIIMDYNDRCFPQVLLLGNGINRCFDGNSWEELLKNITSNRKITESTKLKTPFPLQIILRTENNVSDAIKDNRTSLFGNVYASADEMDLYKSLLDIEFDEYLTTNFSYEFEQIGRGDLKLTENYLREKMMSFYPVDGIKGAEKKYLLHTFNNVNYKNTDKRIWHIHGEARKPDSIIIGHYGYANLLGKWQELFDKRRNIYLINQQKNKNIEIRSWLDAFILGDVYVLGFGYDYSEFDLWWLLDRKNREKAETGKVIFYEPSHGKDKFDEKKELLHTMGTDIQDLNRVISNFGENLSDDEKNKQTEEYKEFYREAIKDIALKVSMKKIFN